jgi:guanylate kinase
VCILEIDINGACKINEAGIPAYYIGILPPSIDVLQDRLFGRCTDDKEIIQQRMEITKDELNKIQNAEFINCHLINDDKEKACNALREKLINVFPNIQN